MITKAKTKKCTKCGKTKPIEEFSFYKKGKRRNVCIICFKKRVKKWLKNGGQAYINKYDKEYRKTSPIAWFQKVKDTAKRRGLEFTFTQELFNQYLGKPCTYCGDPLAKLAFDRVDSNKGYTPDNVVPCCPSCNVAKWTHTTEHFIAHIAKILKHYKP